MKANEKHNETILSGKPPHGSNKKANSKAHDVQMPQIMRGAKGLANNPSLKGLAEKRVGTAPQQTGMFGRPRTAAMLLNSAGFSRPQTGTGGQRAYNLK